MQQLDNALEDDYTKLKGNQYLLKCQTPMKGPWEGEAHQPASSPAAGPSTLTGMKGDMSHWKLPLSMGKNALIVSLTTLLPIWLSIKGNWSWLNRHCTLPTKCVKSLKKMTIQTLNSFARFEVDTLNSWGTGDGSLSCGPSQKELT